MTYTDGMELGYQKKPEPAKATAMAYFFAAAKVRI
jgi:hypothetical protein